MKFEKHVFICINERETGDFCQAKGSQEIWAAFKRAVRERNLSNKIRINKSGCLGQCKQGPACVIYPEGVWYGHLTLADVDRIVTEHLIDNNPLKEKMI